MIDVKVQLALQAARAVAYNHASLATSVKRDSPELDKALCIDDDGRVYLSNPALFHQISQMYVTEYLHNAEQLANHNAVIPTHRVKHKNSSEK